MISFRNPNYLERYEDVVFELTQPLDVPATTTTLAANATQETKRENLRFIVDNTGEIYPFDWYNTRFSLNFRVEKLDGTGNIDADGDDNDNNLSKNYLFYVTINIYTSVTMQIIV